MDVTIYLIQDAGGVGFVTQYKESIPKLKRKLVSPETAEQYGMWRTRPEYLEGILCHLKQRFQRYKPAMNADGSPRTGWYITADPQRMRKIADPIIRNFVLCEYWATHPTRMQKFSTEYRQKAIANFGPAVVAQLVRDAYFDPRYPECHSIQLPADDHERLTVYQYHRWNTKNTKTFVSELVYSLSQVLWCFYNSIECNDTSIIDQIMHMGHEWRPIHQEMYTAIFDTLRDIRLEQVI